MPACPHCHKSLLFVDVVHTLRPVKRWSLRTEEGFACPFCQHAVLPRRVWWSRAALFIGVPTSVGSAVLAVKLLSGWLDGLPGQMTSFIFVATMVLGMFASKCAAKAIVRYEKP